MDEGFIIIGTIVMLIGFAGTIMFIATWTGL